VSKIWGAVHIVGIRSVYDGGTAKPESDFNSFHCNRDLYSKPTAVFKFPRPNRPNECMLVASSRMSWFPSDEDSRKVKNNRLGHSLPGYAEIIKENIYLLMPILSLMTSPSFDISSQYESQMPFDPDRKPSDKDWETIMQKWSAEISVRDVEQNTHESREKHQPKSR
jgi:hypothetical protein